MKCANSKKEIQNQDSLFSGRTQVIKDQLYMYFGLPGKELRSYGHIFLALFWHLINYNIILQFLWMYCRIIFIISSPPQMTITPWGKNCQYVCAFVCVYRNTEAGLCWSYKAVHSGAGGLEPLILQTTHLPLTFHHLFAPNEPPPSPHNQLHFILPFNLCLYIGTHLSHTQTLSS